MEELKTKFEYKFEPSIYKTRRAEIVAEFVKEINLERINTKFKPITHKEVALRLNMNPKLAKDDGECELLLKTCIAKESFSKFFWVCPLNKLKV
jgi:hypothetical protein